ncbi:MAG: chitobiase/beta-hexosaminidase C-terminal domain-containing protein, partial [Verrucomicrobia bacterium]|nr:chitobiase/beta-hexosaminidase C-terminal domain-containing protein [Verrucomicrobiota bacterium]
MTSGSRRYLLLPLLVGAIFVLPGGANANAYIEMMTVDMDDDQTGAFLHSGEQGLNGGLFLRAKNCNSLTISAFNQTLLVNGIEYAYNYVRSPIQVDGQDQFARAGITGHARKGEHNPGLVAISPWRTHHSTAFDVTEGNYDGIYSESPDHEPILYHYETNLKVLANALEGEISHHRIVQFVKESGVWFVLDIMEADRPHSYRQQWWMSKLTEKNPDGYKEEWVSADPDRGMFYSHADSMANLSMYHVGPVLLGGGKQQLTYNPVATYSKQEEWYKGYRPDRKPGVEFLHLTADWHSDKGRSQLITVLYPRRQGQGGEDDLRIERADNGKEVSVTMKNGDQIHFAADGLESTLTVRRAAEKTERGLVLADRKSYEFSRDGKSEDRSPIYRPIGELVISPEISAFADEVEVSMAAQEKDVEIRYTTDGSDPGLEAPLYSGVLSFSESVTLKARAFRKGLKAMPVNRAGSTTMSRIYRAIYLKQSAHEPLPDQLAGDLKQGLKYSYY